MDEIEGKNDKRTSDSDCPTQTKTSIQLNEARSAIKDPAEDEELNALLDSALSDFDKPLKKCVKTENAQDSKIASQELCASAQSSAASPAIQPTPSVTENAGDHPWGEEFAQFENALQSFLSEDPQLKEQWDRLTESANKAASATSDEEFASSLADTLKGLADNAQSISQNASEDDVTRLLGSMGLGDTLGNPSDLNGALPDLLPLMQNVMQNLLSKELLYPALKDMVDKYPDWLSEKKSTLKSEEYERYSHQFDLMKQVCHEFEEESPDDPDDVKKARFERVIVIMQRMQDCGNPPKELLGDMGGDLEFDDNGRLKLPGMPESQCSIM